MPRTVLIVAVIAGALAPALAHAGAPSTAPRALDVPSARLQPSGRIHIAAGGSLAPGRSPAATVTLGLGGLADVELDVHDRIACPECNDAGSVVTATAAFKLGLAEGHYGRWQPAVAIGLRTIIGQRSIELAGDPARLRAAHMFLIASRALGPLQVHAGVDVWDARLAGGPVTVELTRAPLADRVRPLAALAWTGAMYPRTHLLADMSWAPVIAPGQITLGWNAGWGVRYQATPWASVELGVRHRQGSSLQQAEVMMRVNLLTDAPWRRSPSATARPAR